MQADQFPSSFIWGASAAAYQTEGGWNVDGKGPSIWDQFTHERYNRLGGQSGRNATDFYNRYEQDLDLAKSLHLDAFRFSISWSRVLPTGRGRVNEKGLDFYNRLTDACLERGIRPWVTLYHWDLPLALELEGGWTNRTVLDAFEEFCSLGARLLGDRVVDWMVLNEPMVYTGAGYFLGVHAPGRRGFANFLPAMHHATLAMGVGGRVLRAELPSHVQIGTTFSGSYIEPYSDTPTHTLAAHRANALLNRMFLEPILGMGYPIEDLPPLKQVERFMEAGDETRMPFDFDFVGLQLYTREVVAHSAFTPYLNARLVHPKKRGQAYTLMNWEVYPESLYHMLKQWAAYKNIPPIYVTENGAAFSDTVHNGQVLDIERRDYLASHIAQVLRAINEGVDVRGYFVWTLTDNFEWAEGFRPRFGLIYTDFDTQERIVKESGKWFSRFIAGNNEESGT
jgi:beta-glucosidase